MDFKQFKKLKDKHLNSLLARSSTLFLVDVDKDELWNTYLDSFPEGTNEIFRERREFDCSCCRHYIKNFGAVVALEDNKFVTVWDFETDDSTYQPVITALAKFVRTAAIKNLFVTKESAFGSALTREQLDNDEVRTWNHFRIDIPSSMVHRSSDSVDTVKSNFRSTKEVFNRSLTELSQSSIETVLDLIAQNSLYKGEEWKTQLTKFLKLHKKFHKLSSVTQDNFCWSQSIEVGPTIGRIKNHSIGVLLTDITNGVDLNDAVKRYESIVAPSNYKRPKAIFTKKMVEEAQRTIEELDLLPSLGRRHATIDDISINNIIFANKDSMKVLSNTVFDDLQKDVKVGQKNFDKIEEIPIETFITEMLPSVTDIEVFVENKHKPNFMSLIAPVEKDSKPMFKWENNFSWAYNGNITDSMKERVKSMGGKVDGVLRFSIQWNENGDNQNDFDAHCVEPDRNEICYSNLRNHRTGGNLDVDIIDPGKKVAVENITWPDKDTMKEGIYHLFVHNYSNRGGRSGFSAEIEFGGVIHSFEYRDHVRQGGKITVAKIKYSHANGIEFIESLPSTTSSKKIWNIDTEKFQPAALCMFSPNYWDEQKGTGNKHYFFILSECKNEDRPNGFFNEFLRQDLLKHKRVFEALGSKMKVEESENQLSGLGFSSTQRNGLICKLKGNFTRTIKLIF